MKTHWHGVFPAATTQFKPDFSVDYAASQQVQAALIDAGVHGLVALGTCGENNSLLPEEKRNIIQGAVEVAAGKVPVVAGISELDTPRAVAYAEDAEKLGADGLLLLPAMAYVPTVEELVAHYKAVAAATNLPIMLYNNPTSYRVNITLEALAGISEIENIVGVKESSSNTRRYTDIKNRFGERFELFAGLDDVAFEGMMLGAQMWISGLTSAFPEESVAFIAAFDNQDYAQALAIYRWFMPLLHLDADLDLVQCIKLAEAIMGRGSERVRMPRLPLAGKRRADVIAWVEHCAATRPIGSKKISADE